VESALKQRKESSANADQSMDISLRMSIERRSYLKTPKPMLERSTIHSVFEKEMDNKKIQYLSNRHTKRLHVYGRARGQMTKYEAGRLLMRACQFSAAYF
jgi:hypothetical protein